MSDAPLFQSIFGTDWDKLPKVMKRHYANRPFQDDVVIVEGHLDVESSFIGRLLKPFFLLSCTLVPYEGKDVPCTVRFTTERNSAAFRFNRTFHFSGKKPYHFRSAMRQIKGNDIIEQMSLGLCWRMLYSWDGQKVILKHNGYCLRLFGILVPMPLSILIGKGYAEEKPIDDNTFSMMTEIRHPLWGKVFGYNGTFKIVKDR